MFHLTQMILIMDHAELPVHIKQTFRLYQENNRWKTTLEVNLAVEGDIIDLKAPGYVVLYANHIWHRNKAASLVSQINELRPGSTVVLLPVEIEDIKEPLFPGDTTFGIPHA